MKKTQSSKDLQANCKALFAAISKLKNADEAEQFLRDLCTPAELEAMSDRWIVVEPLLKETPYRTIYDQTGVSVTTIGRVARCMNEGQGGYELLAKRGLK